MIRYRLKNHWFDPTATRRRPGIIYTAGDDFEEQLPSGTEILDEKNEVIRTIDRKVPKTEQVVEVEVKTDANAKVEVKEPAKVKL